MPSASRVRSLLFWTAASALLAAAPLLLPRTGWAEDGQEGNEVEEAEGAEEAAPAAPPLLAWTGQMFQAGRVVATFETLVEPLPPPCPDAARWTVTERLDPMAAGGDGIETVALLDASFHVVSGQLRRDNSAGWQIYEFEALPAGAVRVTHRTPLFQNTYEAQGSEPATTTLGGWILFLREKLKADKPFHLYDFDAEPLPGDAPLVRAHVEPLGAQRWRRGSVEERFATFALTRGQRTYHLAFAADGGFRALQVVELDLALSETAHAPWRLVAPDKLPPTPRERGLQATAEARARLGFLAETLRFEGDATLDGAKLGDVLVEARPAARDGRPAYEVVEWQDRRGGEGHVESETRLVLAEDLSIISGSRRTRSPSGASLSTFERRGETMFFVQEDGGKETFRGEVAAPPRATLGSAAALVLLQGTALPDEGTTWILPVFDPRFARPIQPGQPAPAVGDTDLTLEIGPAGGATRDVVVRAAGGYESVWHLDPTSKQLLGATGRMTRMSWAPRGSGAEAADWFDRIEGRPESAHQAFVRFGRGYHLPRVDLLHAAIEWPRMLEKGIAQGAWPKGTTLEAFRKAWVDEFVARSKNRTPADCDDLLVQIFLTMSSTTHEDGSVEFRSMPAYGGHRYTLAPVEGEWKIVAIE